MEHESFLHSETEFTLKDIRNLRRFSHRAMNTFFEVLIVHDDEKYSGQAAWAVFDEVDRLEQELSRFNENSDISRINELSHEQPVRISTTSFACLLLARLMFQETGGAFDISIGSGFSDLELNPDDLSVFAQKGEIELDLGGIGKGYAVDRAAGILRDWGIGMALIHGGYSSVIALEAPPDTPGWPITIRLPGNGRRIYKGNLVNHAMSSSGLAKGDHIINPKDGCPVRTGSASWVGIPLSSSEQDWFSTHTRQICLSDLDAGEGELDPSEFSATIAEALSTAFLIMDTESIREYCGVHSGMWAIVLKAGETSNPEIIQCGSKLNEYLKNK